MGENYHLEFCLNCGSDSIRDVWKEITDPVPARTVFCFYECMDCHETMTQEYVNEYYLSWEKDDA